MKNNRNIRIKVVEKKLKVLKKYIEGKTIKRFAIT